MATDDMSLVPQATGLPDGVFTSESVTEGHPDKVADFIADSVLDAHLTLDPEARVACEVLCKNNQVVLAGEVRGPRPDYRRIVRDAIRQVGYTADLGLFNADTVRVHRRLVDDQSNQIANSVDHATDDGNDLGAGDQGMMYGYATDETPELMPLPILLAHRIARTLSEWRKDGTAPWLRPDAKTQVSVRYRQGEPVSVEKVLVSTQHDEGRLGEAQTLIRDSLLRNALGDHWRDDLDVLVNPAGEWTLGGPEADAGVTGRKIIVDTYGGLGHHGGGAFSGKDPTKVDRSAAYFCRFAARQLVKLGFCRRAEVRVAYAIGHSRPFAYGVNTFGTGAAGDAEEFLRSELDFRPAAIIERLGLRRPIYKSTTNYGHFGRAGLPWEADE
jgi:S-adenosylmethionine synthetase